MSQTQIIPCGDDALRVVTAPGTNRHVLARQLKDSDLWKEVVVGRESVTVQFDPGLTNPHEAEAQLDRLISATDIHNETKALPELELTLLTSEADSPDLQMCAERNGVDPETFLSKLRASDLTVDMLGFAPGFAYVAGADPSLEGGRLENPRVRVPAGSVGFIEGFLGIYALEGPGGWPIVGRIREPLFQVTQDQPFVLSTGQRIRLVRG